MSEPVTTLTIEDISDEVVDRLRRRAEGNHRSLQDELLALITAAAREYAETDPSIFSPR